MAGPTQYMEGDVDASITGVATMWEDTGNVLRAVSAAKPLPVSGPLTDTQLRATAVPVSGTVTANQGTAGAAGWPVTLTTGAIHSGAADVTPKFAFANVAAGQTDASLVAAVALKKIRVLALAAVAGATATTLTFNSKPAGAGTAISCLFANGANGGEVLPFSPAGWFETAAGEGLSVTTGAGSTTGIQVVYIEV